jgi:hypothetical protein
MDDGFVVSEGIEEGRMLITQRLPRGIVDGMKANVVELSKDVFGHSVLPGEMQKSGSGETSETIDHGRLP